MLMSKAVVIFVTGIVVGLVLSTLTGTNVMQLKPRMVAVMAEKSYNNIGTQSPSLKRHTLSDVLPDSTNYPKFSQCNCNISAPITEENNHKHNESDLGSNEVAQDLYNSVRVLVWVMTHTENLEKQAKHINMTWGKRANKILFASDTYDPNFPTMPINVPPGYEHLADKTMAAFDYVYENYLDQYDWFMKVDDDTFVIMENLRYFLSSYNTSEPVYFGNLLKGENRHFYSGGAGYVLSREALKRLGQRKNVCKGFMYREDLKIAKCMEDLGIKTQETLDKMGRTRFHCLQPWTYFRGHYPAWFKEHDKYNGTRSGHQFISNYAITFHYITRDEMYDLEFFMYHLRPYGIQNGLQESNRRKIRTIKQTHKQVSTRNQMTPTTLKKNKIQQ